MEFKFILKELREEYNISQKELAQHCGLTPQCISALEKGINSPTLPTLIALKKFFGNELDDYLNDNFSAEERIAGATGFKKVYINPIEDDMLYTFRQIGKKYGDNSQRAIIAIFENFLKLK